MASNTTTSHNSVVNSAVANSTNYESVTFTITPTETKNENYLT